MHGLLQRLHKNFLFAATDKYSYICIVKIFEKFVECLFGVTGRIGAGSVFSLLVSV